MKKIILTGFAAVTILISPVVQAAPVLVDNFNNGTTDGWTDQDGTGFESAGTRSGTFVSLATYDGLTSNSLGVDAIAKGGGISYVALVLNYNSLSDNLFVKIQDNNGNGLFDRVFFYHGNNTAAGILPTNMFKLSTKVASTYFEVTDNLDGTVSAYVSASGDTFDVTLVNSYSGTGIGLGFFGKAQADNFYAAGGVPVPEPAPLALLGLGLVGLGVMRRRKA
ncbi:MAG: hypothetical protein COB36_09340 [Alphaproteobacteria bacterium]|nr:MAG: hypothetical protein COB36_09340 [Alphaproteobacteria bacterium]